MTPEPAPPPNGGKVAGWLNAVKGLTLTNAVVIIMLGIVAVPSYWAYRVINDPALLDRFSSYYRELGSQHSPCTLREGRSYGSPTVWGISHGFAYSGNDRYVLTVWLDHEPEPDQLTSYCATLALLVDFMRDPDAESPDFPDTDEPIIRQYERNGGAER